MKKVIDLKKVVLLIFVWVLMLVVIVIGCLGVFMGICFVCVKKLMIFMNICGKKFLVLGYKFYYFFEEVIVDWYKDNDNFYLK